MIQPKEGKIYSCYYKQVDTEIYRYVIKNNETGFEFYVIMHDKNGLFFNHIKIHQSATIIQDMQKYLEDKSDGEEAKQLFLTILFKLK